MVGSERPVDLPRPPWRPCPDSAPLLRVKTLSCRSKLPHGRWWVQRGRWICPGLLGGLALTVLHSCVSRPSVVARNFHMADGGFREAGGSAPASLAALPAFPAG